jgi:predicted MFS family arabinose efflux permease
MFAALLVQSFGWSAMGVVALSSIIAQWFDARRGLAIAIGLTGASVSGLIVVPPLQWLMQQAGFAQGALIAAVISLVAAAPLALFMRAPAHLNAQGAGARLASGYWTRARAARSAAFWSITAPFMALFTTQVGFLVHEISVLKPHLGASGAAIAVGLTTSGAILGRLILGALAGRVDLRVAGAVAVVSQGVAMALAGFATSPVALYGAAALYGVSVGNVVLLPTLLFQREFESASFARLISFQSALCSFACAFGAILLGGLRDLTGDYSAPLAFCALVNLVAGLAVALWRPRPRISAKTDPRA